MLILGVAIALAIILMSFVWIRVKYDPELAEKNRVALHNARVADGSAFGGMLLTLASPISGVEFTNLPEESPLYRSIRLRLAAAGGLYGNSVTVYLSTQIAAVLVGLVVVVISFFSLTGLPLAAGLILGCLVAYYPYSRLSERLKKRLEAIDKDLPEFAELLIMPLSSGYGIIPALDFTASRLDGPVASEVKNMLQAIASRSQSEEQAFEEAGDRLGTPAAVAFFTALAQAYFEGVGAVEVISGQAEQLRKLTYERVREKLKKLPIKLVVIIGIHFMPAIFITILLPLWVSVRNGF